MGLLEGGIESGLKLGSLSNSGCGPVDLFICFAPQTEVERVRMQALDARPSEYGHSFVLDHKRRKKGSGCMRMVIHLFWVTSGRRKGRDACIRCWAFRVCLFVGNEEHFEYFLDADQQGPSLVGEAPGEVILPPDPSVVTSFNDNSFFSPLVLREGIKD